MLAFLVLSVSLGAAPQQATSVGPVSLERVREELKKPAPALDPNVPIQVPIATFRTRVEQRVYVPTLHEWIREEFKLTALQRQSADWAARCCDGYVFAGGSYGVRLNPLFKSIGKALQRRRERKIREQIARELAQVEAARTKAR